MYDVWSPAVRASLAKSEAVYLGMGWHTGTVWAHTVAFHVETQSMQCLVIKLQPLFALVEAVMHWVRWYAATPFTVAGAKFLIMIEECLFMFLALFWLRVYFHHCFQCRLQWLTILPPTSLQVYSSTNRTQLGYHELRGCLAKAGPLRVIVLYHGELVYPQYRP